VPVGRAGVSKVRGKSGRAPTTTASTTALPFGVAMMKLVLSGHVDEVVDTVEGNIRHI
jgi:hypothetical protein